MDEARVREIGESIGVVVARVVWAIAWVALMVYVGPFVAGAVGHIAWRALLAGWRLTG